MSQGLFQRFEDVHILDGVRTPMVDYLSAFAWLLLERAGMKLAAITVARQLKEIGARWGVASACIGGGHGIALLIENTEAR